MRRLSEPIARQANREDGCKAHILEARFKCQFDHTGRRIDPAKRGAITGPSPVALTRLGHSTSDCRASGPIVRTVRSSWRLRIVTSEIEQLARFRKARSGRSFAIAVAMTAGRRFGPWRGFCFQSNNGPGH
jgi:hypothetical protein